MRLARDIFPGAIGVVALTFFSCPVHAGDAAPVTARGSGCVEAGVEEACRILRDLQTREVFNLFFNNTAPAVNTAVAFEGTRHDNPNICMQGKPVDVREWHSITLQCPQPEAAADTTAGDAGMASRCGKWTAWYNVQPGVPKTLHVAGVCTFPDSGYKVALTKHVPTGSNPKVCLLDLTITPPVSRVSHLVRTLPVQFAEQADVRHESVEILPDHVLVPVQTVQ